MSESTTHSATQLSAKDVQDIATLSRLDINDAQANTYASSLNDILALMQALQSIDTTGVEPLKSPFDTAQPLRTDEVSEPNRRDDYQAIAPATQDGLYLVPRVIE